MRHFMLIGVENQTDLHYAMPVKNMVYDALNYGFQVKEAAKKHRKNRDKGSSAEFLSGFYKEDKLTPVITLTVYWGADQWDAPRCLYDMFGTLDEHLKEYIPNYYINPVIPQEITDFEKFRTSLGVVLEIIKASEDEKEMTRVFQSNPKCAAMDNETVAAINTFIGTDIPIDETKGETDMCKAWDDRRTRGLQEGRKEGRKEGRREGADEQRLVAIRNMIKYGVSKNCILQDYSEEEYDRAQSCQPV